VGEGAGTIYWNMDIDMDSDQEWDLEIWKMLFPGT
jgi:hypothetical protein